MSILIQVQISISQTSMSILLQVLISISQSSMSMLIKVQFLKCHCPSMSRLKSHHMLTFENLCLVLPPSLPPSLPPPLPPSARCCCRLQGPTGGMVLVGRRSFQNGAPSRMSPVCVRVCVCVCVCVCVYVCVCVQCLLPDLLKLERRKHSQLQRLSICNIERMVLPDS